MYMSALNVCQQVILSITPLCEGELDVLGVIYHLCVDQTAQVKGSESPQPPSSKTSLPSLNISSRDPLYQRHQHSLAEGVQVDTPEVVPLLRQDTFRQCLDFLRCPDFRDKYRMCI